jgi:hypothetical protein
MARGLAGPNCPRSSFLISFQQPAKGAPRHPQCRFFGRRRDPAFSVPGRDIHQSMGCRVFSGDDQGSHLFRRSARCPVKTEVTREILTDVVERILLVHNRVQENPHCPDVLLFATICLTLKDFGSCVIWIVALAWRLFSSVGWADQWFPQRHQKDHSSGTLHCRSQSA